ncbi:MAG: sulfotransferase [Ectothiorhodospiraceae bacterium]|nr:sulfotransferase [Ectothiorhodospiraceae bacterium]
MSQLSDTNNLMQAIDDARALLSEHAPPPPPRSAPAEPLPSLLERCKRLCTETTESEPIRTIHHFACTGGTLFAKCLASMPNTQVLSEVDPLSPLAAISGRMFFPTDLISLAKSSSRGADEGLVTEVFLGGLQALYDDALKRGLRLVLRDHAHSHFCIKNIEKRRTTAEIISGRFPVVSVVTVRHPIDSYLSLVENGWRHFEPRCVEEYAARYFSFLSAYKESQLFRYEDLVDNPQKEARKICDVLGLQYEDGFTDVFSSFKLSGDSGRNGAIISKRGRRKYDSEIRSDLESSKSLRTLCEKLGYEFDLACK